ncbi:MAG: cation:proton antiporter [Polyangiaceae bacterium]|nr:cation:proton antiporter [Polyangiaceae bacterium]MBK8938244.1 cation:proton antiporter [Polyangiaceae bacterium]
MPHHIQLILTLTGGLAAALVLGVLAQRLRLSPIVGYLLAGLVVGPFTPGFTADQAIAEQLAEIGVILMMFGVGLHFHVEELLAVRRVAVPGALVQIAAATALGALVTTQLGWPLMAGVVFGLAISVASTVVLLRVLTDSGELQTRAGHIAVGWLIVEDLFTVLALVLLPLVVSLEGGASASEAAWPIALAIVKISALVALLQLAGRWVVPRVLHAVAKLRSRELFSLSVLVFALGIAVGSAKLFGASMALGAFLAGMAVGQSEFSTRAASEALPVRDLFAVLFFVSTGMLFDPAQIVGHLGLVFGTLAVVLVGKPLAAIVVVLVLGYPARIAARVGMALAQIGEFSFIVAVLGRSLGVLPESAMQALVAGAMVSMTLNPILYRLSDRIAGWLPERTRPEARPVAHEGPRASGATAIVVGFGPIGRTVTSLLTANGLRPFVIELNHETVRALRSAGVDALYGDASQSEVLEQAGIRDARTLVFTASGSPEAIVRLALELNPDLRVLTRATYLRETSELHAAGAKVVVAAESEIALTMAAQVLFESGAPSDQLEHIPDRLGRHSGALDQALGGMAAR